MKEERTEQSALSISEKELGKIVEELCNSKAEEFALLGYEGVTGQEIWDCVSEKYRKGTPALHQIVSDILSLKTTQFMNWITMSTVYKVPRP